MLGAARGGGRLLPGGWVGALLASGRRQPGPRRLRQPLPRSWMLRRAAKVGRGLAEGNEAAGCGRTAVVVKRNGMGGESGRLLPLGLCGSRFQKDRLHRAG